jgi:hypothetical protein
MFESDIFHKSLADKILNTLISVILGSYLWNCTQVSPRVIFYHVVRCVRSLVGEVYTEFVLQINMHCLTFSQSIYLIWYYVSGWFQLLGLKIALIFTPVASLRSLTCNTPRIYWTFCVENVSQKEM